MKGHLKIIGKLSILQLLQLGKLEFPFSNSDTICKKLDDCNKLSSTGQVD